MNTSKVGRNDTCPCGSGRKAKKCHTIAIGWSADEFAWYLDMLTFIEQTAGYVPPMPDEERQEWKRSGCPLGFCPYGTEGVACAAGCGV